MEIISYLNTILLQFYSNYHFSRQTLLRQASMWFFVNFAGFSHLYNLFKRIGTYILVKITTSTIKAPRMIKLFCKLPKRRQTIPPKIMAATDNAPLINRRIAACFFLLKLDITVSSPYNQIACTWESTGTRLNRQTIKQLPTQSRILVKEE